MCSLLNTLSACFLLKSDVVKIKWKVEAGGLLVSFLQMLIDGLAQIKGKKLFLPLLIMTHYS